MLQKPKGAGKMEQLILKAIMENGWEWTTIKLIFVVIALLLIIIALKNFLQNVVTTMLAREMAFRRVKNIPNLKMGCGIRFANPYEYLTGTLSELNRRYVFVKTDKTLEIIPILLFDSTQKSIMIKKKEPSDERNSACIAKPCNSS